MVHRHHYHHQHHLSIWYKVLIAGVIVTLGVLAYQIRQEYAAAYPYEGEVQGTITR